MMSTKRLTLLVSGNRFGKSEAAMREVLCRARGEHPYKRVPLVRQIWVGVPGFKFMFETTLPHFYAWCPPAWLQTDLNLSYFFVEVQRKDGGICKIYFKTYDQGREPWQGAGVGYIHLDEECPRDIYKEARARLVDTRGSMGMTLTPVSGMGWIYDEIYLPGKGSRSHRIEVVEGALAEYVEDAPMHVGRVLVPHLSYEDVLEFAEEFPDEDELAIRVFGQFRKRAGLVYKAHDPLIHEIPSFELPKHWLLWGGVDPGFHGFAAGFWAMAPNGRMYKVQEYFSSGETTSKRLKALARIYFELRGLELPKYDYDVDDPQEWMVQPDFDPMAETCVFFVDTEDPQTILELNVEAARFHLPIVFVALKQGQKAIKPGILRMQQLLAPSPNRQKPDEVLRPTRPEGEPMAYYFDDLHSEWAVDEKRTRGSRTKWEFGRYTWAKPKRKDSTEKPDLPDKESAGGAHMLDADRYAIMARLGAPEPSEEDEALKKLSPEDRAVWEDVRELEARQLERAGLDVAESVPGVLLRSQQGPLNTQEIGGGGVHPEAGVPGPGRQRGSGCGAGPGA